MAVDATSLDYSHVVAIGRSARRTERLPRVEAVFGKEAAPAALDLLELTELAWHDCYGEVTPPEDIIDEILFCSGGDLMKLAQAARLAVEDARDLKVWAQTLRDQAGDSKEFAIKRLDHVQIAIPEGGEAKAEEFYAGLLGFEIFPKPPPLAVRGGRWFGRNGVQLHMGIERDFTPARKAHPALVVRSLNALVDRLAKAGIAVRWDAEIPEVRRCYVDDPFGNRIELIEASG
jgi:catechol 2,3-dioxygenase-like lactoylglutathione lyase family enzyme